ncbi:MAG: hypothetical protein QM541_02410 [Flavobacterium sp.]|nr:hypothetical protein [Flavobacterium sp.]
MFKLLTAITFLLLVIGNEKIAVPIVLLLVVNLDGVSGLGYFGQIFTSVIGLSLMYLIITAFLEKPYKYYRQITLIALFILLIPVIYFAILGFKYYLNVWVMASHLFFPISYVILVKRLLRNK